MQSGRLWLLAGLFALASAVGCSNSVGGPTAEGKAVLLSAEPAGAQHVDELKSGLITGLVSGEVAVVGRVGSGHEETWDTDQASFLIRDLNLKTEAHDHGGNHENCNFCKEAKAKELESMALVRVVDSEGHIIATDARKLLGLKENHIIVASGEGEIDNGTFVFNAKRIYIRR